MDKIKKKYNNFSFQSDRTIKRKDTMKINSENFLYELLRKNNYPNINDNFVDNVDKLNWFKGNNSNNIGNDKKRIMNFDYYNNII